MTLSHRINQTRESRQPDALAEKFYLYWGQAVRSLNDQLQREDHQQDDVTIAGILTLLLTDVSLKPATNHSVWLNGVCSL